jgi:DNA-binding MarR family transcriptional regulator
MDHSERRITKIARNADRFTALVLADTGLGSSEYDLIHCVRHNPGISQSGVQQILGMDRAAVARTAANLEKKGYLTREPDETDHRPKRLFPTEAAEAIKRSRAAVQADFYDWLFEVLTPEEENAFLRTLDTLYFRSRDERKAGFQSLLEREAQRHG